MAVNPILQRAADDFARTKRSSIAVPEWGEDGAPLVIWFDRSTFRDKSRIWKKHQANDLTYLVDTLIAKARTGPEADAKPMFTEEDRDHLLRFVDPDVVVRIGNAMLAGLDATTGDAAKN